MAKAWADVEASPQFQSLNDAQRDAAKQQYFRSVVAPKVPEEHRASAWKQFSDLRTRASVVETMREGGLAEAQQELPSQVQTPLRGDLFDDVDESDAVVDSAGRRAIDRNGQMFPAGETFDATTATPALLARPDLGERETGNIDRATRPTVRNSDGSVSTVRSITVEDPAGGAVLIPTVSDDGRVMSDEEATARYLAMGRHLGKFDSIEAANIYAQRLSAEQGSVHAGGNDLSRGVQRAALGQPTEDLPPAPEAPGAARHAGNALLRGAAEGVAGQIEGVALADAIEAQSTLGILERVDSGQRPALEDFGSGRQALLVRRYQEADAATRARIREKLQATLNSAQTSTAGQIAQSVRSGAESAYPLNPEFQDSFWLTDVPQGAGSTVPFLAEAAIARRVAGAAGASPLGSFAASSAAGGYGGAKSAASSQFNDALQKGASFDVALEAAQRAEPIGYLEGLPMADLFRRLDRIGGTRFRRALVEATKQAGEEGIQEAANALWSNYIAKELYDKDRALYDGMLRQTGVGGVVGGIIGFLGGLLSGGRRASSDPNAGAPPGAAGSPPGSQQPGAGPGPTPAQTGGQAPAQPSAPGAQAQNVSQPEPSAAARFWQNIGASPAVSERLDRAARDRAFREGRELTVDDAINAVDDVPDAELQAVSMRYKVLRDAGGMTEQEAKERMRLDALDAAGRKPAAPGKAARPKPADVIEAERQLFGDEAAPAPAAPAATSDAIDAAAHQAATSPQNDLPEPTQAQKDAGNYQKGHVRVHGLDVSIENPKGSRRRPEWPELTAHYGYIRGTVGRDKDHIDVFIGDKPEAATAFVVDQIDPKTGRFDEHKVVLGAESEEEARALYQSNYSKDWKGLGAVTAMPIDQLKSWLATNPKKPAGTLRPQGELVDEADPAERTRANIAGETPERASLIVLRDVLDEATDTMNDGQMPPEINGEASELARRITEALDRGGDISAIRREAFEIADEWVRSGAAGEVSGELEAAVRSNKALAPSTKPEIESRSRAEAPAEALKPAKAAPALPRKRKVPPRPAQSIAELGDRGRLELLSLIRNVGGLNMTDIADITGERGRAAVRMAPGLFRNGGLGVDDIATLLHEAGFLTEQEYQDVDGGVERTRELVQQAIRKQPVVHAGLMNDYLRLREQERAEAEDLQAALESEGLSGEMDAEDVMLVQRAATIVGEDAFEREAIRHGDDDAALLAWARSVVDDAEKQSTEVGGRGEEAVGTAEAAPGAGSAAQEPAAEGLTDDRGAAERDRGERARATDQPVTDQEPVSVPAERQDQPAASGNRKVRGAVAAEPEAPTSAVTQAKPERSAKKPLRRIKVTRQAIEEDTGRKVTVRQRADHALNDVDRQIAAMRGLLECLR